ncbi:MAG: hypothetical protein NTY35_17430 [Planctomycetota bacterium]|nr:hypothetical protein [Planctomycetota bacterium]
MRLEHPIFQGPRHVELEFVTATVSANHAVYPPSIEAGETRAWLVQQPASTPGGRVRPGLVCDGYGFEDSPDCEWISSGSNSKGPMAMAIGRQANRFLWGFHESPSHLTQSGRDVLVNAIAYMDQFDGVEPLVVARDGRGILGARDHAIVSAHYLGVLARSGTSNAPIADRFPERVRSATGLQPERTLAWYRANLEFLVPAGPGYDVDDACVEFGIGNRDPRFVAELVGRLERDPNDPAAKRLLARYVPAAKSLTGGALAGWYDGARPFLYFTDRGGFEWRVDEPARAAGTPRARVGRPYVLR